jgi:hypothetical protein
MGHRHDPLAGSQNLGNSLGSRPCVRQSRLYRKHESGNAMKGVLGSGDDLAWDEQVCQGAYQGSQVYDAFAMYKASAPRTLEEAYRQSPVKSEEQIRRAPASPPKPRQAEKDDRWETSSSVYGGGIHASPVKKPAAVQTIWQTSSSAYGAGA